MTEDKLALLDVLERLVKVIRTQGENIASLIDVNSVLTKRVLELERRVAALDGDKGPSVVPQRSNW